MYFLSRDRMLVLACLLFAGCAEEIDASYGRRSGVIGGDSVNGTAVLSRMFEQAGHRVFSWRYLSPRLNEADVLVWFPNRFQPPGDETRQWLEEWLADGDGRTLIYVGRDFDAEPDYWSKIQPQAPADQQAEVARRLAMAQARYAEERASLPADEDCEWFRVKDTRPVRSGAAWGGPWLEGVNPSALEIELNSTMQVPEDAEVLLSFGDEAVVSRQPWGTWESYVSTNQLVVVHNGSFLLNLPLVNHEHRKLAGKLVKLVEPAGTVVFLESGPSGDPKILDEDPQSQVPTGMEMFFVWPLNYILLHLALAGIIFCFSRWPIFGLAKNLPEDPATDFGKHIAAVGQLLHQTHKQEYARERIRQYYQTFQEPGGRTSRDGD